MRKIRDFLKKHYIEIYCVVTAFLIILFCSRSSPLYIFNNWDDANSYFTVGKSIFHGKVPYRDLFDQKGILLYFLYGMASLISYRSFAGVFVIEIIAASVTLIALQKTAGLYLGVKASTIMMPLMGATIYSSRSFWWGGSAEEMMLPFLATGLYLSMKYYHEMDMVKVEFNEKIVKESAGLRHNDASIDGKAGVGLYREAETEVAVRKISPIKLALTGGILAGCVLHIKFNSLGFYIGWILVLMIVELFEARKDHALVEHLVCALQEFGAYIGGMAIATLPWMIYFGANHAIKDWIEVYFYDNIFIYSEKLPVVERIKEIIKIIYYQVLYNKFWAIPAILGIVIFWLSKESLAEKFNVFLLVCGLTGGIYIGAVDLPYYPFSISIFAVFGIIAIGKLTERMWRWYPENRLRVIVWQAVFAVLAVGVVYVSCMNLDFMKVKKDDFWLFSFAKTVEASGIENPDILNVSCLDAGLFTVTGAVPNCRFFQTQTIKLDDVAIVQTDYIVNERADFLVGREGVPEVAEGHYQLLQEASWEQSGSEFTYWLCQKVSR